MNKSKFLKKSLAAILSVLMVVAMIPLSAAAATAPKVYLDNQQIDFAGGNSQSVTITPADTTSVSLTWDPQSKATLKTVDKGDSEELVSSSNPINLASFPVEDGVYTVKLKLYTDAATGGLELDSEYTLLVTVKDADVKLDATIVDVKNISDMVSAKVDNDKNTITITMPYNKAIPTTPDFATNFSNPENCFVPYDSGAGVAYTASSKKVTVSADNAVKEYSVKFVNQDAIKSFTVPTQVGETEIKNLIHDNANITPPNPQINITVEKSTNFDKVIPTFEVDKELVEKVTTYKGKTATGTGGTGTDDDEIDVESGVTELAFDDTPTARTFNVYLKGESTPVKVKVKLTSATNASEAELTSIQIVDNGYDGSTITKSYGSAKVTGKDVTVVMGVNTDFTATADIIVDASAYATVTIPSQDKTATAANGYIDNVNISGKKFTIYVDSQDGKTQNKYNITLLPATQVEAKLTDFSVKYDSKTYTGTPSSDGMTFTVNMPFAAKGKESATKVYATASAGASAFKSSAKSDVIVNGTTDLTELQDGDPATTNTGSIYWYSVPVAADDHAAGAADTARTYTIKVVYADPKTGNLINSAAVVGTRDLSAVTEDNTYKTELGKVKTSSTEVDAIKVTLPHSVVVGGNLTATGTKDIYFKDLKVSPEATVYGFTGTQAKTTTTKVSAGKTIKQLDEKVLNEQTGLDPITVNKAAYEAYDGTELDLDDAYVLYVVSEQGNEGVVANTTTISDLNAKTAADVNTAKKYYVYFVKDDPAIGCTLTSIKSVVDTNVTAELSGGKITITVPDSYNLSGNPSNATATGVFTLNFKLSKLASMKDSALSAHSLTSDNGKDTTVGTKFFVKSGKLYLQTDNAEVEGQWVVTSEDNANRTKYPVAIKVNPAEKGAEILTLKCGTATATKSGTDLNLRLPFGSSLNPVKLDITASKMANVKINNVLYDAKKSYSLMSDLTITVTSEDGKTVNVYTLKTTVGDQFTDVPSTAWFAPYVKQAADKGIINGKGNGIFDPMGNVTRQEFANMLVNMLKANGVDTTSTLEALPYKDGDKIASWAKDAVLYCAEKKIINGYTDGEFKPTNNITRQEAAKMLAIALNIESSSNPSFADANRISDWAKPYVAACQAQNIFTGDNANRFNPVKKITRAEAAKVMVESLKIK